MADSDLQNRANQAQIDLLNKLDRNSDVGVGFYVGFKDTVLSQLRDILKNLNKEATTQLNKGLSEINTSLEKGQKQQEEQNKKLQDTLSSKNGKLGKVIDEMTEAAGASQATALKLQKVARFLSAGTEAFLEGLKVAKKATLETAGLATDLKEAGVILSDGKKSFTETLKDTSLNLGMAREDVVKVLRGSSEQMTKFGVATGKNLNSVVNEAMQHYKNIGDLSSSNAEAIMKMQLDAITQSMTQEELSRYNLQQGTAKLTKNIVELSLATGKSVEAITKEQQQRNQNILVQHAMDRNKVAASRLYGMGLGNDQDALEFILTGKINAALSRKFAGNEQYKNLILSLQQAQRAGQLENATTEEVAKQFNPLLEAANATAKSIVDRLVQTGQGNIMYSSPEYQEGIFAGYGLNTRLNENAIKEYNESLDKGQKGLITQNKLYNVLANDLETLSNSAKTSSVDGFSALNKALKSTVDNFTKVTGWISFIEKWIHEKAGIPAEGTIVSLASGAGGALATEAVVYGLKTIVKDILGKDKAGLGTGNIIENGKSIPNNNSMFSGKLGRTLKWANRGVGLYQASTGSMKAYESFKKGNTLEGIFNGIDALAGAGSMMGGGFGAASKAWQYGRLIGSLDSVQKYTKPMGEAFANIINLFDESHETNLKSMDKVKNILAMLKRETQLSNDKIVDLIGKGISPDQIKAQYGRINTGVEEIKQEKADEVLTDKLPQQIPSQKQMEEINQEEQSAPTLSLSKETIQELTIAFATALSGNTDALKQFANGINKTYQEISSKYRMNDEIVKGDSFISG